MEDVVLRFRTESKAHIHLVKRAARMLNEAFVNLKPKVIFCVPDRGCDYEVEFISGQKMATLTGRRTVGFCDRANRRIYILCEVASWVNEPKIVSTIAHEMLHALGVAHSDKTHSLMFEDDIGVRGVTGHDVEAVANLLAQNAAGHPSTSRRVSVHFNGIEGMDKVPRNHTHPGVENYVEE